MTVSCCPLCKVILTFIPPKEQKPLLSGLYTHDFYGCPRCGTNYCKRCVDSSSNECQKCGDALVENQRFIIEPQGLEKLPPFLRKINGLQARLSEIEVYFEEFCDFVGRRNLIFDVIQYEIEYERGRFFEFNFCHNAYRNEFQILRRRLNLYLSNLDVSRLYNLKVKYMPELGKTVILDETLEQYQNRVHQRTLELEKNKQRLQARNSRHLPMVEDRLRRVWSLERSRLDDYAISAKVEYNHTAYNKYWYTLQSDTEHPDIPRMKVCFDDFIADLCDDIKQYPFREGFNLFVSGLQQNNMMEIW